MARLRRTGLRVPVLILSLSVPALLWSQTNDLVNRVSVERLRETVSILADAGGHGSRVTFTAGNDSARRWILRELSSLPLDSVWADTFFVVSANSPYREVPQFNVLGYLGGTTRPKDVVVLGAHYDASASHEPDWNANWGELRAPGADDNATGVAILLEAARVCAEVAWRGDASVLFAAFAAEEYNPAIPSVAPESLRHHLGAAHLAQSLAAEGYRVRGLVNVDMVGFNPRGNYVEFVADEGSQYLAHLGRNLIRKFRLDLACNEPPFPYNTYSDHEAFARWGYPALLMMENDRPWVMDWPFYQANPFYHTSQDEPDRLNWSQIDAVAKLALALVVELASDSRTEDVVPPPPPTLLLARAEGDSVVLHFRPSLAADLAEIRVYNPDSAWATLSVPILRVDAGVETVRVERQGRVSHFLVTAADTCDPPNESTRSDCYGAWEGQKGRVLIVDGFDRWGGSGSWGRPYHWFTTYIGDILRELDVTFATCANELVASGTVRLSDYDAVFWVLGDESTGDETFSAHEQLRVREYLRAGGRIFVSGSELGWDLGHKGSSSDRVFLRDYLHVQYKADDSESYEVRGVAGSPFDGLRFSYGSVPYEEDYPDVLDPASGAVPAFLYANGAGAGACFAGRTPGAEQECRVVTLGFPFETIDDEEARREIVRRTLAYFGVLETGIRHLASAGQPSDLTLAVDAFPNPFNARATIEVRASVGASLVVRVWNTRGRLVQELYRGRAERSLHRFVLRAEGLSSGMYVVEAEQGSRKVVRRLTLVR